MSKARRNEKKVGFLLEQPASPKEYMPQTVSFWDTSEWKEIKNEFGLCETTFNQGHLGGLAAKPTTFGGNVELDVDKHKSRRTAVSADPVRDSKALARWSPGAMNMVASHCPGRST